MISGPIPAGSPQVKATFSFADADSLMSVRFNGAPCPGEAAFARREKLEKASCFRRTELTFSERRGRDLANVSRCEIDVLKSGLQFADRVTTEAPAFQSDEVQTDDFVPLRQ